MNGASVTRFLKLVAGRSHFLARQENFANFIKNNRFMVLFYFVALTRRPYRSVGRDDFSPCVKGPSGFVPKGQHNALIDLDKQKIPGRFLAKTRDDG